MLLMNFTQAFACTNGNEDPYIKYLNDSIAKIDVSINAKRNELYNLKVEWFETCVKYLNQDQRQFKKSELKRLIEQTVEKVDGKELLTELRKAYECVDKGTVYHYQEIPRPIYKGAALKHESAMNNNHKKQVKEPTQAEDGKRINTEDDKPDPSKDTLVVDDKKDNQDGDGKVLKDEKETPNPKDEKKDEEKKDNKKDQDSAQKKKEIDRGSFEGGKSKGNKSKDGGLN